MKKTIVYATLAWGALASAPVLSGDGPTAEMLAYTCAGCHGTDGSSVGPATPSIAGTDAAVFTEAMMSYKKGERPSTIMTRIAKGYSDAEINQMAEFFAAQKLTRYPQTVDAAKAAKGKALHEEYCEKCHEDGGRNPKDVGVLAGQWMPYLEIAMQECAAGDREQTKKMKSKVEALIKDHGKESIQDIIQYYGSQH